ncbi:MAG: efflux RND transporter periplasmic adaptor subunit, partial [Gammaproteobacteria bacterium]|nr:efflux RND transporter periplasmic adaptor subunit [Gammaproteobacteria bacterium]
MIARFKKKALLVGIAHTWRSAWVCAAVLIVPGWVLAEDALETMAPLETLEISRPPSDTQALTIPPPLRSLPTPEPEQRVEMPTTPAPNELDLPSASSLSGRFERALTTENESRDVLSQDRFAVPVAPPETAPPPFTAPVPDRPVLAKERAPAVSIPAPRTTPINAPAAPQRDSVLRDPAPRETAIEHAKKHQDPMYVCPMHPSFTTTNPNDKCPICGMNVVPITSDGDAEVVKLSPTIVNALGVRTEKVKRRNLYRKINSVGIVDYNQNKMRSITLRTEAWVERLRTKSVGEHVRKGDVLFDAYSPILVSAQEEYLNALEIENGSGKLVRATAQRLAAFGFSEQQIARLAKNRKAEELLTFYAPFEGIVSELNIREGGYIAPSTPVMVLADLSTVWLIVDVFESQALWVQAGLQAEATLPVMAEKQLQDMVDYVYPTV